jgi:hypothetical protein
VQQLTHIFSLNLNLIKYSKHGILRIYFCITFLSLWLTRRECAHYCCKRRSINFRKFFRDFRSREKRSKLVEGLERYDKDLSRFINFFPSCFKSFAQFEMIALFKFIRMDEERERERKEYLSIVQFVVIAILFAHRCTIKRAKHFPPWKKKFSGDWLRCMWRNREKGIDLSFKPINFNDISQRVW